MSYLVKLWDDAHRILDENADPRTTNWFLIKSPVPTWIICACYIYFVKVLGPRFMENRKPYELKKLMIAYNIFQVVSNSWLFINVFQAGWLWNYSFLCQPVDKSNSPEALKIASICYWYYISKFVDFIDTVFFVLRKKKEQVSVLHVTHHAILPIPVWFGIKYVPGGHSTFFGLINTLVHVVMYTYYLLAALGPSMRKYLWWKKYLTTFQMVQFVIIICHALQLLFIECDYPKMFAYIIAFHAVLFFVLFKGFYTTTYNKSKITSKKDAAAVHAKSH